MTAARQIAADWFARKRSGAMTVDDARALEGWLAADPDHRAALESVELMWAASQAIRSEPAVLAIREEALKARRPTWRGAVGGAIAAGLVVLVLAGSTLTPNAAWQGPRTFTTSAGQTSTITLPDGSKVTLDADTILRAHETSRRRNLELVQGRAFFRVAKDPARPFVVAAGDKTVTAIGTAFDVSLRPDGVRVTLLEGKVKVDAPIPVPATSAAPRRMQSTEMTAGSQLVAPDNGSWRLAKVDAGEQVGWAAGQLVFAGKSLAQVANELNRRSDRKVIIADPSVGRAVISGSFDTGDVEAFVQAVESYGLARVETETPDRIELGAP
jgi:transmembrane sensor